MSSYTKFTLNTFRDRLKKGAYENLTGANRAIGKTQELSDSDKDKARALAIKHFGGAATVKKAPAKVAKKAAKKAVKKASVPAAAPKKVAKKATSKAAPKKKAAKKAAKPSDGAEPAPGPSPKAQAMTERAPALIATPAELTEQRKSRVVEQMGSVISTIGNALKSMEDAKQLFPKADLEVAVTTSVTSMCKAVQIMDQEILDPRLDETKEKSEASAGKRDKAVSLVVVDAGIKQGVA